MKLCYNLVKVEEHMKTKLIQTLKPTHKISMKQVQSLAVLAMNQTDVETFVNEIVQEHPLLEIHSDYYPVSHDIDFNQIAATDDISLVDELLEQINTSKFKNINCAKAIIYHLDSNGYLLTSFQEIKRATHFTIKELKESLLFIQTLQPYGVGARDLKECLMIQCKRMQIKDQDLVIQCIDYLQDLSKGYFAKVAKALETDENTIKYCLSKIKLCNPKPGANFNHISNYIYPEITIIETDDDYIIQTKNISQFLSINQELNETADVEVKKYIKEQTRVLKELLNSLAKRESTLQEICTVLFHIQKDSILHDLPLKPCTYKQVAELVNRHPSTVFRCIQNKAMQYQEKVILLSSLFTNQSTDGLSSDAIKDQIKKIVQNENKNRPFSDEQLVQLLKERDIHISRRCIAKYRDQCRIPNSTLRKTIS